MVATFSSNLGLITCNICEISVLFSNAGVRENFQNAFKLYIREELKKFLQFFCHFFYEYTDDLCILIPMIFFSLLEILCFTHILWQKS